MIEFNLYVLLADIHDIPNFIVGCVNKRGDLCDILQDAQRSSLVLGSRNLPWRTSNPKGAVLVIQPAAALDPLGCSCTQWTSPLHRRMPCLTRMNDR